MAISLTKGGNVSLTKSAPGLKKMFVGLGWDARITDGSAFDLDASVYLLGANGKVRSDADFIFFNNLKSAEGSVEHMGDNLTGAGEGDDEVVKVDLDKIPADVTKLVFGVTIYDADKRKQNFGMVRAAFIRVVNQDDNKEVARYDLSEDYSTETAMLFGELYKHNDEWKFKAIGEGFSGGHAAMAGSYGVNVG
ncbi:MAG: TerD family protein [Candidatus Magnetobacterium sp. LHC-1]|uniref:TerD family protein n=1 Tax=Candidatus Magnetobacterium casense TaxID=1455061 RepID=A0ABS6S103_9BACT|nr:TerD family protein [Candidatus Magnetobacterium casensis]MBF0606781.1 TerD family protein [Nitrospirota bacterium]MBV6342524.1 TerD family protein [Candidatus Magnetobacterium casensis]